MLLPAGECLECHVLQEIHGAQADPVLPGAHGLPLHLWGAPGGFPGVAFFGTLRNDFGT